MSRSCKVAIKIGRSGWLLPFLDVAPSFDAVRDTPRFQRLAAQIRAGSPAH